MQSISLLRSQTYNQLARFAVPFSKPAEAGENGLGTSSPAPRVRAPYLVASDKEKEMPNGISFSLAEGTGLEPDFCDGWNR